MVVLIDTNVILDFLRHRPPFYADAKEIMKKCAAQQIQGYMAFHSISNLFYILRKYEPETRRRGLLKDICKMLTVVGASHEEVVRAIDRDEFTDLEDCLQVSCAKTVSADYVVTRNLKDFSNSEVPAITPNELLLLMNNDTDHQLKNSRRQ